MKDHPKEIDAWLARQAEPGNLPPSPPIIRTLRPV
jgi:hypothetical protein